MPTSNALYMMQVNGMAVDRTVADRYRRLYSRAIDIRLDRIHADRMVRRYVKAVRKKPVVPLPFTGLETNPLGPMFCTLLPLRLKLAATPRGL